MDSTYRTRDVFLYSMALIYMFAFGSWFIQIPGLYGDNGILPIKNLLQTGQNLSIESLFSRLPTLLWLFLFYGFSHQTSFELLCLIGTFLSFVCLLFRSARILPVYALLWFMYFSLFQVGQTFSWFQWDTLLLESGFLAILVSPSTPSSEHRNSSLQRLPFFLVKWLLFRLMFASGVVKLTSMCPTWWGLTALHYHFETQCIPTPLSWWAHQLPNWLLKLSVVGTYVIEIALPFLFFAPVRRLRLIGVYGQVFLMFTILLSGNYNFFNFLTLALCLAVMDDKHLNLFLGKSRSPGRSLRQQRKSNLQKLQQYLSWFSTLMACIVIVYYTIQYFSLQFFKNGDPVYTKTAFTQKQFTEWVDGAVIASIWIGGINLLWEAIVSLYLCLRSKNVFQIIWNLLKYISVLGVCVYMFCISMVPFKTLMTDKGSWPVLQRWHDTSNKYQLVHSYGLFRSMTGVGGRPEVIVKGSHLENGPWQEIEFQYKPGNTSRSLPWIVPHQPRLDWQMWFAALGQYQQNPWFLSLVDKMLSGEETVVKLLDKDSYPFKETPPKYIKAELYHYHFTLLTKSGNIPKGIWRRNKERTYLPKVDKNDKQFKQFLKFHNLDSKKSKKKDERGTVVDMIRLIRDYSEMLPVHVLLWSLWFTAMIISVSKSYITRR
ncbi:lipase maturation factor 2-like [Styela clava]